MKTQYVQDVRRSFSTRVIRLNTAGDNPWVVCTQDAVPVILARFSSQSDAEKWQAALALRGQAA